MAPKRRRAKRLPKAPLAEVVFELRWALQSQPGTPPVLQSDPGLLPLLNDFSQRMQKLGFGAFRDMAPPLQTGAYGVTRRYFKKADSPFPIMQVGPGIFAANESSQYEWGAFKKQVNDGIRALLAAYPKIEFAPLTPNYLELRYIDAFDKSLTGSANLFDFAESATSLKFELPTMLNNRKIFSGGAEGRFSFVRDLKGWKPSRFVLDIGSGKNAEEDIVHLTTKVTCAAPGVPKLRGNATSFVGEVNEWLEFAHDITSPLFEELIRPEIMKKFGAN